MPLVLNGTTGVSGVDGSAGTPALRGTDADSGVYFTGSQVGFSTNGAGTTMTMDANGNVTFPGTVVMSSPFAMRNKIINGAMMIDQRNAGASVTNTTASLFVTDRFYIRGSVSSKFTGQQSTTAPSGFTNSLICTSSSAYTVGASEAFFLGQVIEGFNIADLGWGTASAVTVTLSFWVRSSLTGTFGGSLCNYAGDRSYPFAYTISSANTWEQKTITISGDTTGTWNTNNSGGIVLNIGLGAGSTLSGTAGAWAGALYRSSTGATSVVGTNGATFYLTGVQLEVGSVATPFERRPYGLELALCQRYYERMNGATFEFAANTAYSTNGIGSANIPFKVTKRAAPTLSGAAVSAVNISLYQSTATPEYATVRAYFGTGSGAAYGNVGFSGTGDASAEL